MKNVVKALIVSGMSAGDAARVVRLARVAKQCRGELRRQAKLADASLFHEAALASSGWKHSLYEYFSSLHRDIHYYVDHGWMPA